VPGCTRQDALRGGGPDQRRGTPAQGQARSGQGLPEARDRPRRPRHPPGPSCRRSSLPGRKTRCVPKVRTNSGLRLDHGEIVLEWGMRKRRSRSRFLLFRAGAKKPRRNARERCALRPPRARAVRRANRAGANGRPRARDTRETGSAPRSGGAEETEERKEARWPASDAERSWRKRGEKPPHDETLHFMTRRTHPSVTPDGAQRRSGDQAPALAAASDGSPRSSPTVAASGAGDGGDERDAEHDKT